MLHQPETVKTMRNWLAQEIHKIPIQLVGLHRVNLF